MIIYRPHRGGLRESMAEAIEFESVEAMKEYIVQQHLSYGIGQAYNKDDIVIERDVIQDSRVGWMDTQCVCIKRWFNEKFEHPQCIGMCATDYGSLEQSHRMCEEFLEERE